MQVFIGEPVTITINADASDVEIARFREFQVALAGPDALRAGESYRYTGGQQSVVSSTGEELDSAQTLQDFRPLAINVIGSGFDTVIVYTGSTWTIQDPPAEAPLHLDGAGVGR
ncbi:hypothetical protein [Jannaschia seohaensis]|uniref:Uncharacterized protein n=1 Tax=Jannaschia seohaensis TaxID=475081 RepID=A0A2Y9ABM1_9RHOB|nr:hypothetical protein [Jannaschia seohaensis]PWJ20926.1 hypothetical protein BCF38_102172 [Jannaschia seohaensis]SSA41336.1 hypothetical protein SAMN05421539_102172 [Jannaschia seohaensis]